MTDIFVEQPEEELISSLTPDERDPLIPSEVGEYFDDVGQVIDEVFSAGWWGDNYVTQVGKVATTLRDFVQREGTFAPPEEEEPTTEDRKAQRAQEIMPAGATPEDQGTSAGLSALKTLHFEQMTGESAFVKFINWLRKSGVTTLSREGAGIGRSAIYEPDGRVTPAFQGDTSNKPTAEVLSFDTEAGQKQILDYLRADWRNIPDLVEVVQQKIADNWSTFMAGVVDGKKPGTLDSAEADPALFGELMRQFGGYGDGTTLLVDIDDAFGGGSAADILGGTLDAAITEYAAALSKQNPSMLVGPEIGGEGKVGFITSFDGTPYGDIRSVNDLFSGGKIGPMDAYRYMKALYNNTRDASGYSPIIDQIQQELFAWGILEPTDTFVWGHLDIPGMEGTADRTIDALQMFQVDIINEALAVPESELDTDATAYIDTVMRNLLSRNVNTGELQDNQAFKQQEKVIKQISQKIQTRISNNPNRLITEQGVRELEATITEMMGELGSEQREKYFGRGGSAKQQQLVDLLMSDFYGDSDWGSQIYFGSRNSDDDFMRYASRAGALTENEVSLLERGMMRPDNYRDNWDPNDVMALQHAEKDVVTANLVKFITDNGGWEDANALRKGLITYAHTIGQRTASERGYSNEDYGRMVQKAMQAAVGAPAESELVTTLDERLAQSMDLVGGEGAPDFRRLMDSVNNRRKSLNTLRVRNV